MTPHDNDPAQAARSHLPGACWCGGTHRPDPTTPTGKRLASDPDERAGYTLIDMDDMLEWLRGIAASAPSRGTRLRVLGQAIELGEHPWKISFEMGLQQGAAAERERLLGEVKGTGGTILHENCVEYADILAIFADPEDDDD